MLSGIIFIFPFIGFKCYHVPGRRETCCLVASSSYSNSTASRVTQDRADAQLLLKGNFFRFGHFLMFSSCKDGQTMGRFGTYLQILSSFDSSPSTSVFNLGKSMHPYLLHSRSLHRFIFIYNVWHWWQLLPNYGQRVPCVDNRTLFPCFQVGVINFCFFLGFNLSYIG